MRALAALAAKTTNDEEFLGKINDALLQLQLEAAGKSAELGYKPEDLEASRDILRDFLEVLSRVISQAQRGELASAQTPVELAAEDVLTRLDDQGKPREDWLEDINRTSEQLKTDAPIKSNDWALLEQLIDFLDAEFAQDLAAIAKS